MANIKEKEGKKRQPESDHPQQPGLKRGKGDPWGLLLRSDLQALLRASGTKNITTKFQTVQKLLQECLRQELTPESPRKYVAKTVSILSEGDEEVEDSVRVTFTGTPVALVMPFKTFLKEYPKFEVPPEILRHFGSVGQQDEPCGGCAQVECKCCEECDACGPAVKARPEEPRAKAPRRVSLTGATCCQRVFEDDQLFCQSCGKARPDRGWCSTCEANVRAVPGEHCGACSGVTVGARALPRAAGRTLFLSQTFGTSTYCDRDRVLLNSFKQSVLAAIAADKLVGAELWNFLPQSDGEGKDETTIGVVEGQLVAKRKKGLIATEFQFTCALGRLVRVTSIIKPARAAEYVELQEQLLRWIAQGALTWEGALYYLESIRGERAGTATRLTSLDSVVFSIALVKSGRVTFSSETRKLREQRGAGQMPNRNMRRGLPDAVFRKVKEQTGCIRFQLGNCKQTGPHDHRLSHTGNVIRVKHTCAECQSTAHGWNACPGR